MENNCLCPFPFLLEVGAAVLAAEVEDPEGDFIELEREAIIIELKESDKLDRLSAGMLNVEAWVRMEVMTAAAVDTEDDDNSVGF